MELSQVSANKIYQNWLKMEDVPGARQQEVARRVFGLNVDPAYGKIVEPKESGGVRIIELPEETKPENWGRTIAPLLESRGWKLFFTQAPRSTLSLGRAEHPDRQLAVDTQFLMPQADLAAVLGLCIAELELEIAIAAGA